ncbi:MAG: 4Fe-4S dicluster domain-containing protein [Elusimicrobiota bacterium]
MNELLKKIEEISGQNLFSCYQCGKCSAGCPMVNEMDILPNQVIRLAQIGLSEKALNSKTIWLCASCYTCEVRCPRGVDLAKVMEALRQIILRQRGKIFTDIEKIPKKEIEELPQMCLISNFRKTT